jgi:hypothetical protein
MVHRTPRTLHLAGLHSKPRQDRPAAMSRVGVMVWVRIMDPFPRHVNIVCLKAPIRTGDEALVFLV